MAIEIEVLCGDRIQSAIERALALSSQNHGDDVTFDFNGVDMCVNDKMTPDDAYHQFTEGLKKNAEAHRNSPKGKKSEAEQQRKIQYEQDVIDDLLEMLPHILEQDLDAVVKWVGKFAALNDNINLKFDRQGLADIFKQAGFKSNAYVGDPDVKDLRDLDKSAHWLVGQAIDNLEQGMPIHPMASHFAEKYLKALTPDIHAKRTITKMKRNAIRLNRRRP